MQSEAIEKAVQDYTSRLSRERLPAHLVAFELNNLALKVREMTLEEAATHCETTELLMPIKPEATRRQHGIDVCYALAAELRRMKGYICK
jgi:hypothetical protein